eukprot:EG_transcript_20340
MATKQLIASLRNTTGAGLMLCKKALEHSNGDLPAAVAWLADQGQLIAAKKSARATLKGVVAVALAPDRSRGLLAEVNVETDFCARNATFLTFSEQLARLALEQDVQPLTPEAILPTLMDGAPVSSRVTSTIATIGENLTIRRFARVQPPGSGMVAAYLHNALSPSHGLIATLVALSSDVAALSPEQQESLQSIGQRIAMHVTADRDNRQPLLQQPFLQGEATVGEWLEQQRKALGGCPVEVAQVASFEVGEGLDAAETDFAAEVARQLQKAK